MGKARAERTLGLVFESHLPERVRLPEYPARRGTKVPTKPPQFARGSGVSNPSAGA